MISRQMLRFISLALIALYLSACVEHRLHVETHEVPGDVHIFKNGSKYEGNKQIITVVDPLPTELYVDAWYRDQKGHLYRAHQKLLSPRPWWQRFPFDMITDGLWAGELAVEAESTLQFKKIEPVEPNYLDTLATEFGYGSPPKQQTVAQPQPKH